MTEYQVKKQFSYKSTNSEVAVNVPDGKLKSDDNILKFFIPVIPMQRCSAFIFHCKKNGFRNRNFHV